jgi:hypothetical protein
VQATSGAAARERDVETGGNQDHPAAGALWNERASVREECGLARIIDEGRIMKGE